MVGFVAAGLRKSFQGLWADQVYPKSPQAQTLASKLGQKSGPTGSTFHPLTRHSKSSAGLDELAVVCFVCSWGAFHCTCISNPNTHIPRLTIYLMIFHVAVI